MYVVFTQFDSDHPITINSKYVISIEQAPENEDVTVITTPQHNNLAVNGSAVEVKEKLGIN